jgi:hypothetical protein
MLHVTDLFNPSAKLCLELRRLAEFFFESQDLQRRSCRWVENELAFAKRVDKAGGIRAASSKRAFWGG